MGLRIILRLAGSGRNQDKLLFGGFVRLQLLGLGNLLVRL
jgi:hypothetical protein